MHEMIKEPQPKNGNFPKNPSSMDLFSLGNNLHCMNI